MLRETEKEFFSDFGYLWCDRLNAFEILEEKAQSDTMIARYREKIEFFIKNGYVIFEGAVSPDLIDNYLSDFEEIISKKTSLLASVPAYGPHDKSVIAANEAARGAPLTKYLDTYWFLESAIPLIFNQLVTDFLKIIFEEKPLAFQGLHFEVGSTQRIHQDTAYVVSEKPLALTASWLALEDINEGSGELMYYEGSHRLPDWKYSGKYKHYNHERDKPEEHLAHLNFLQEESERRGYPLKTFLPKKGDVLIWNADLAHGGSQIINSELSRKSLVTHYCPSSLKPHYFNYLPQNRKIVNEKGNGKTSTFYY